MRYSPMYDWSSSKFWINFFIGMIIWICAFGFGMYIQNKNSTLLKYVGYFLMGLSIIFSASNLMSVFNRKMWKKNKYNENYISKFDKNTLGEDYVNDLIEGIKNDIKDNK